MNKSLTSFIVMLNYHLAQTHFIIGKYCISVIVWQLVMAFTTT